MFYRLGIYTENSEKQLERTVFTKEQAKLAYFGLKKEYGNVSVWVEKIETIGIKDLL